MGPPMMLQHSLQRSGHVRHPFRQAFANPRPSWIRRSQAQADASTAASDKRSQLAQRQAALFSQPEVVSEFLQQLPPEIEERLATIVASVPGLGPTSRVCDVGSGTGCLIPHLQARGVQDILAVDTAPGMLQQLQARFHSPGTLGNEPGVRTWQGDFLDLPQYYSPFDAIFMNAVFGNMYDPRQVLLKAALSTRPGGFVAISHPMGKSWHSQLASSSPDIVPHELPDIQVLDDLVRDLPLYIYDYRDEPDLYLAVLQVPRNYRLSPGPVRLEGPVVKGFGRGSRQLGVPTANIDPALLGQQLQELQNGVYFGWAKLDAPEGWAAEDSKVHKMVMNIGRRPTVNTGDEAATVEVHIMHSFSEPEFYGSRLRVVVLGFLRPELKFAGLPQLMARIRTDIGLAKAQLDEPEAAVMKLDEFF